jgi:aminopeptidase N
MDNETYSSLRSNEYLSPSNNNMNLQSLRDPEGAYEGDDNSNSATSNKLRDQEIVEDIELNVLNNTKDSSYDEYDEHVDDDHYLRNLDKSKAKRKRYLYYAAIALVIIAIIVLIGVSSASSNSNNSDNNGSNTILASSHPENQIRLANISYPTLYTLNMDVDMTNLWYSADLTININLNYHTDIILLHAGQLLEIDFVELRDSDKNSFIPQHSIYKKNQYLVLVFGLILAPGENYSLKLKFSSPIAEGLAGFYQSNYTDANGISHTIATTQFEATDARHAFPCYDEPAYKAAFAISISHSSHYIALSNMPGARTDLAIDRVKTQFEPSKRMSTYLVAFIVCDFARVSQKTKLGVTVNVYAQPEKINQTALALKSAVRILEYYEDYFNIKFPLPKEDLIAIPDFSAGAMENWGLITYRETALLYDELNGAASDAQRVVVVVAHELAHQWFGNLVTMKWWDDLWLNEGFATFVEYIGTNAFNPTWNMLDQFVESDLASAESLDSSTSTHPIVQAVNDPGEIGALFDGISYAKGGAVIRQLLFMLTGKINQQNDLNNAFINGLVSYLNKYAFANAESANLWSEMQIAADKLNRGVNVVKVMNEWTTQPNYPVVTVRQEGANLVLSQKPFLKNPDAAPRAYKYSFPVQYFQFDTSNKNVEPNSDITWFNSEQDSLLLTPNPAFPFIKLNPSAQCMYRVNYTADQWQGIFSYLITPDAAGFSVSDRASLVDDAFELAHAKLLDFSVPLQLLKLLKAEDQFTVWAIAAGHITKLSDSLSQSPDTLAKFRSYIRSIVAAAIIPLDLYAKADHNIELLQQTLSVFAVIYGVGNTAADAVGKFDQSMANNVPVYVNARNAVYAAAMLQSDSTAAKAAWNKLYALYKATPVAAEKIRILRALARINNRDQLTIYLSYTLNQNEIRGQDGPSVAIYIASYTDAGLDLVWNFLKTNFDALKDRYLGDLFSWGYLIKAVISLFRTEAALNDVKTFFATHDIGAAIRSLEQGIENIEANIKWINRYKLSIDTWLTANPS